MGSRFADRMATYSIVARDEGTGHLGAAVQTHQMAVGNIVPWLEPGAGALVTQALTNVRFGPTGLELLQQGIAADRVIKALVASDDGADHRQVAVVDAKGRAAAWTGEKCIAHASHHAGEEYSVQANMMTSASVVPAMAQAYDVASGDLAARMMAAMHAAQAEGGDIRGMQSAALVVVPGKPRAYAGPDEWRPVCDLRVDEHTDPLAELDRLVGLRRAQLVNREGHDLLDQGQREAAEEKWRIARQMAPGLEEMAYWQALALADEPADILAAMAILEPMLEADDRRQHWIDLIRRCQASGLFERPGVAEELLKALGETA